MRTVLIVDDEFDVSEAIGAVLRAEGYEVAIRADGREALEYLKGARPCLVVVDMMMPYLGGLEVLEAMKASQELAQVPVILMSAVVPSVKQPDYGWAAFLKKPFNVEALMRVVTQHARESDAPAANP